MCSQILKEFPAWSVKNFTTKNADVYKIIMAQNLLEYTGLSLEWGNDEVVCLI